MTTENWILYGQPGWGSAIVDLQLGWYGLPTEFRSVGHLFEDAAAVERLRQINPLAQIPTLILPDGQLMTESGAITLLLADSAPADRSLVPPAGAADRATFLRWLLFINSAIYPCYTVIDRAEALVPDPEARGVFSAQMMDRLLTAYRLWDGAVAGPWCLGDRLSALDFYAAVMVRWTPKPEWFSVHAPSLRAVAQRVWALPDLAAVWRRNELPGGEE